jgi:small subunit ribosomal protein S4
MSRYTGPRARISRRLGTNIFGTRGETIALDKRPYPPGEHGRTRRRSNNQSEYLVQLQEKQKARFSYGLTEKQFRRIYEEANRREGVTGENMLRFLELRLDNVVYRAGLAATRPQARHMVVVRWNIDVLDRQAPAWLAVGGDGFEVTVNEIPVREQIDIPVREHLIVELYSK